MGCAQSQEISYMATVPPGAVGGQTVSVMVNGAPVLVKVPFTVTSGQMFRFKASEILGAGPQPNQPQTPLYPGLNQSYNQLVAAPPPLQADQIRVTVPPQVYPGQQFDIVTPQGQRLRLQCPPNTYTGQTFIAQIPPAAPPVLQPAPVFSSPAVVAPMTVYGGSTANSKSIGGNGEIVVGGFTGSSAPVEIEAEPYNPSAFNNGGASAPIEVAAMPVSEADYNSIEVSRNAAAAAAAAQRMAQGTSGKQRFEVLIPQGVRPGQNFEVNAGGQRMMVQCPPTASPGQTITIEAPVAAPGGNTPPPVSPPMSSMSNNSTSATPGPPAGQMDIVIPPGVMPGQTFEVVTNGTRIGVKCPPNTNPGQKIRIQIPPSGTVPTAGAPSPGTPKTFQVTVPNGIVPGANFEVQVGGKKAVVQCPPGARPGQMIQISV